ncbi:lipopolysaccharide transport periplasmic protein LptA [Parendozoicomonas sp. Alg238-R29]|uniref:lipopolysaccharide transport periplasmic protein LptA n=1 Tax=Parendozoicomonas sp. Alg238-R29 TaxID=2993446 RepID=UPI00248D7A8A|nr:lipopolysaccharide transport periplasmic protein LptA [Parendozoicomonas sp. Alg238-R29]
MKAAKLPFYLALAAVMATTPSWALNSDREKPIHITSDNADIDDAKGIAIYRGDVVMTQGSTKLTGDIITIYSQNREIKRVVSEGDKDLAYYEEEQEGDKGLLKAWGITIDYNMGTDKIKLIEKARLIQKGDTFIGDQINYDQLKQLVNATGGTTKKSGGRVQMVIQPNQAPGSSK